MATAQDMMKIGTILVEHCKTGKENELMDQYYSADAVSVEAVEMMAGGGREAQGLEAIKAKAEWWMANNEVHSTGVEGPFVHGGNQFSVIFDIDVTMKQTGERAQMREIGTYTVQDGKIVREEFYYAVSPE